ncbi:MAG: tetratricopeptide repeat protein [Blastocatellales bacterium]
MTVHWRTALLFLVLIASVVCAQQPESKPSPARIAQARLSATQWKEDLNELVRLLEQKHPNLYSRISKTQFAALRRSIERDLPNLSEREIIVRLMKLVSAIRDGHTTLHPVDPNGFNHWFPVSFYKFSDGFYVVAADKRYQGLIGGKVINIGNVSAAVAFEKTADLLSSDNDFGREWNTFFLSSGDALAALRVIERAEELPMEMLGKDGKPIKATLTAVNLPYSLEHRFWGEMFPPGSNKFADSYLAGFESASLGEWRKRDLKQQTHLPLHLRSRRAYWYAWLPEQKAIYLHMTHVTADGRGEFRSFKEFHDHVFQVAEANAAEKFILDIRYNSGGDGSVLIPFIHKFIRSSRFNEPGRLFTITGRKTYSAGVMLYDLMLKHTNTILVGEPAGAPRSSYGDAGAFHLKHSRLQIEISSVHWQLTNSADKSRYQPVDAPAVFSSREYFSGADPAVDYILSLPGRYKSLPEVLLEAGGAAFKREYAERQARYSKYGWWKAFDETALRYAARDLMKAGKRDDGKAGFEILLAQYPQSWRAWRDFGNALLAAGEKAEALRCFRKGLEINPGYDEFRNKIRELEKGS